MFSLSTSEKEKDHLVFQQNALMPLCNRAHYEVQIKLFSLKHLLHPRIRGWAGNWGREQLPVWGGQSSPGARVHNLGVLGSGNSCPTSHTQGRDFRHIPWAFHTLDKAIYFPKHGNCTGFLLSMLPTQPWCSKQWCTNLRLGFYYWLGGDSLICFLIFILNNMHGKHYKFQLQHAPKALKMWAFKCFSAFPNFWLVTNFRWATTGRTKFLRDIEKLLQIVVIYSLWKW